MEQEEFKKKVLPLREQLLTYAYRILESKEEAEDIVQEVFLKLWYLRYELDKYDSIPALSIHITKNLCLNRLKILQRKIFKLEDYEIINIGITPYSQLEQKDHVEKVMLIIDQLPGLQQTILRMKHIDGLEVEEIAAITGSKPDAIRMNLSRARKKIKDIFFTKRDETRR